MRIQFHLNIMIIIIKQTSCDLLQIYEFNVSTGNMWYTKLFEIYLNNYTMQLKGKGTHICH